MVTKNQSGFSLVGILIAIAAIFVLGGAFSFSLIGSQDQQRKQDSQRMMIENLRLALISVNMDLATCFSNLDPSAGPGRTFDSTVANPSISLNLLRVGVSGTSSALAQVNQNVSESGVVVDKIELKNLLDVGSGKWSGQWSISFKPLNSGFVFKEILLIPQIFTMDLTVPTSASVTACFPFSAAAAGGWSLTGNNVPSPVSNYFFGTLNDVDIVIKRNGSLAGLINSANRRTHWGPDTTPQAAAGNDLTSFGHSALKSDTLAFAGRNSATGSGALLLMPRGGDTSSFGANSLTNSISDIHYYTAYGSNALKNFDSGFSSDAIGYNAFGGTSGGFSGSSVAIGADALSAVVGNGPSFSVAVGKNALRSLGDGGGTAVGFEALKSVTPWINHSAMGSMALSNYNSVNPTTALGYSALRNSTSGSFNMAIGANALLSNISGMNNIAVGLNSLNQNLIGSDNVATGSESLYSNDSGNNNIAVGSDALWSNVNGNMNTAVGFEALFSNVSGIENTAFGSHALQNATGDFNVAVGAKTLLTTTTGQSNTAIGYAANTVNFSNSTAIGNGAIATANNMVRFGNGAVTVIEGAVAFTNISDRRFKKNISDYNHGLDLILQLRPVTYNLKSDPSHKTHSGFIAQEVESIGVPFYGLNIPENEHGHYSISYAEFVVPLVNAINELKNKIQDLSKKINELIQEISDLDMEIQKIEKQTQRTLSDD